MGKTGEFALTIWSGGQTGVDRAAHDAAAQLGLRGDGWCPQGRLAEDGRIPERYPVRECTSAKYPVRTRLNVEATDATLVIHNGEIGRGSKLTISIAENFKKPCLVVDLRKPIQRKELLAWIETNQVLALNVAGPRESSSPGIHDEACAWLVKILTPDSDS